MKKATIYDYARMCKTVKMCENCPLYPTRNGTNLSCDDLLIKNPEKANEIILKWVEEHPIESRQNRFLLQNPKAKLFDLSEFTGENRFCLSICPLDVDYSLPRERCTKSCIDCKKDYWFAEVEENE